MGIKSISQKNLMCFKNAVLFLEGLIFKMPMQAGLMLESILLKVMSPAVLILEGLIFKMSKQAGLILEGYIQKSQYPAALILESILLKVMSPAGLILECPLINDESGRPYFREYPL